MLSDISFSLPRLTHTPVIINFLRIIVRYTSRYQTNFPSYSIRNEWDSVRKIDIENKSSPLKMGVLTGEIFFFVSTEMDA